MLREARLKREPEVVKGFRIRGREVTRLESFSDTVFGFALTLLVVSLDVPKNFDELLETMRGFVAFGICFAILAGIWNHHYVFCRRFGLDDGFVRFLTCVMLFIVLLYVYPLKFLFTLFVNGVLYDVPAKLTSNQASTLFLIYGLGFAAVYLALAALNWHAYHRSAELEFSPREKFESRWEIYAMLIHAGVGLASAAVAVTFPPRYIAFAGFAYFGIALLMTIHRLAARKHRRQLQDA
jgi:uncharacterized membrane protein